jgi:Flp pilus assembly protein TadG
MIIRESRMTECRSRAGDPRRRGTAALEFVIVLPVLFVIVIGATDLSRIMHAENVVSNAARAGAAYGATHQYSDYASADWESRVEEAVRQEAAHVPSYDEDLLDVDVTTETDQLGGRNIRVEVTYPFELVIDWPGWPAQIVLTRQVTMRAHR